MRLWKKMNYRFYLPFWQFFPEKPLSQRHLNVSYLYFATQEPPFWQGEEEQGDCRKIKIQFVN